MSKPLCKRAATSSAHEFRDIKKTLLREKNRGNKPLTFSSNEYKNLRKGLKRYTTSSLDLNELRKQNEDSTYYDTHGHKCSPTKKIGHGSSSNIYHFQYDIDETLEIDEMDDYYMDDKKRTDSKVIKMMSKIDESTRKDFKEEINILRKTDSPQIVKYFGTIRNHSSCDAKNSEVGIILEYCENGDLYQKLQLMDITNKKLDQILMIKWCRECIVAIKYLHDNQIIHRDIKSLNFLINKQNTIKLSDFGKSRKNTSFNRDTTLRRLRSSPCWTAPELCNWDDEDNNIATYSSDIFALTIVMWEIIYYYYHNIYKKPYQGNIYKIYDQITNGKRPETKNLFTDSCKTFLKKGWNTDQNKRPDIDKFFDNFNIIRF